MKNRGSGKNNAGQEEKKTKEVSTAQGKKRQNAPMLAGPDLNCLESGKSASAL